MTFQVNATQNKQCSFDPNTGIPNFSGEHYNPSTGIFLSEDPIGFRGKDLNLYRYVKNNPLKYNDQTTEHPIKSIRRSTLKILE